MRDMRAARGAASKLRVPATRSRIVLRSSHRALSAGGVRTVAPLRAALRRPIPVAGFDTRPQRVEEELAVSSARDAALEAEPTHKIRRGRGRGARHKNRG